MAGKKRERRRERRHPIKGRFRYRIVRLPGRTRKAVPERREYARHYIKGPVSYRVVRLPSPEEMVKLLDALRSGSALDISKGGFCFRSSQLLLPGTLVAMDLPVSPIGPAGQKLAMVKWVSEFSSNMYRVGVKFL